MSQREFYFCVGSPLALHSGVWKVWIQGDELYATQIGGMAAVAKLSVHRSGVCRLATTNTAIADVTWDNDADPRVAHRWRIEEVGASDSCICLTYVVPAVVVPQRFAADAILTAGQSARVVWVEPSPIGGSTLVTFVRTTDPNAHLDTFLHAPFTLLGSLQLREGSRIWAVRQQQPLDLADFRYWQGVVQETTLNIEDPAVAHFACFVSPADFSHPVLREIALGHWNIQKNG